MAYLAKWVPEQPTGLGDGANEQHERCSATTCGACRSARHRSRHAVALPWMSTIVNADTGQVLGIVNGRDSAAVGGWLAAAARPGEP